MGIKKLWNVSNKSMVMFKFSFIIAVLIGLVVFIASVLAAHTSSVLIEPEFAAASSDVTYTITVTNEEGDDINRVKIDIPEGYTNLQCNEVEGWDVDVSTSTYCIYVAYGGNAINESESVDFTVDVTTNPEECYQTWSVYTTDAAGYTYRNDVDTKIDATPPTITKTVGEPNIPCEEGEECDYYVTQDTPIYLECLDQGDHPVDQETVYWRFSNYSEPWEGEPTYSEWYNASYEEFPAEVYFEEDSWHDLEYYCVDHLGNEGEPHTQYYIVDTKPPVIEKEIVGPHYEDFIDSITEIHVDAYDPTPHPVDEVMCEWWYYVDDQGPWHVDSEGIKQEGKSGDITPPFVINFPEETKHDLWISCWDALGNGKDDQYWDHEVFYVDHTSPTTTKTYGEPHYPAEITNDNYPHYISNKTQITLTVEDTGPHKSGVKEVNYRWFQIPDENCGNYTKCQEYETIGITKTIDKASPKLAGDGYEPIVFTIPNESCHMIEYYSVDNVSKTEDVNKQCVFVDNTPPIPNKTVGDPKTECQGEQCEEWDWLITLFTPITLNCTDPEPHPVGEKTLCFKIYLDGEDATFEYNEQIEDSYCGYYGGTENEDGFCCVEDNIIEDFMFEEECTHRIEFYCIDKLGNEGPIDDETFKVEGGIFTIQLNKKWNLISVPFVLLNDDPEEIFQDVENLDSVWTYDGETDEWYVYTADEDPDTLNQILTGWGYWVKMDDDDELLIGGSLMQPKVVPPIRTLIPGWNLIGYYGTDGETEYDYPDGDGKVAYCALYSLVNTNSGLPQWSSLETYWEPDNPFQWKYLGQYDKMDPGAGYWIEMDVEDYYAPATVCPD